MEQEKPEFWDLEVTVTDGILEVGRKNGLESVEIIYSKVMDQVLGDTST